MEGLKNFLTLRYGYGSGYDDGSGYGYGYGYGDGYGYGSGDGYGYGYGDGYRDGYGYGYGDGDGSGSGYGSGSGSGSGSGLLRFCGNDVHYIDGLATVIQSVKGFVGRGFVINNDLTTKDVWIVRVGNSFAHGNTLKEAQKDAEAKHLQCASVEERVQSFLQAFKDVDSISASDLFDWHFTLTGSCEFGRREFVKQKGINLETNSFTIPAFIELTRHSYGSDVIQELEKQYLEQAS